MGFIKIPMKKRIKRKIANTKSLREAQAKQRQWLNERGLYKMKPKKNRGETLTFEPIEERTGVPLGNKFPVSGGKKQEPIFIRVNVN